MTRYTRHHGDQPDLMQIIRDLQKRVSALERIPRAGNTSIDHGGTLRVHDEDGNVRVELGKLADGSYGLQVQELVGTDFISAGQVFADYIAGFETCTASAWTDLATLGPSVDVNVTSSGRLLCIATAWVAGNAPSGASINWDAVMGIHLSGANNFTPNTIPGEDIFPGIGKDAAAITVTSGNISLIRNGAIILAPVFNDLQPGLTTVTVRYGRTVTGGGSVSFMNRSLTVIRL